MLSSEDLVTHLSQQALPVFLVAAVALFEVFKDALEVGVAAQLAPCGINAEPGIVLVAQIDGAAQPVQRFAGVAFDSKVVARR